MQHLQITFKSGAQIDFWAKEFSKRTNTITNQLAGVNWENGDMLPELFYIKVEDITSIVILESKDENS